MADVVATGDEGLLNIIDRMTEVERRERGSRAYWSQAECSWNWVRDWDQRCTDKQI